MKSEKTKFSKVLACNLHESKTRRFAYGTISTLKLPWISSVTYLVSLIITYYEARRKCIYLVKKPQFAI